MIFQFTQEGFSGIKVTQSNAKTRCLPIKKGTSKTLFDFTVTNEGPHPPIKWACDGKDYKKARALKKNKPTVNNITTGVVNALNKYKTSTKSKAEKDKDLISAIQNIK
jgi:hypothetical protein